MHTRRHKANVGTAAVCDISEMTIASRSQVFYLWMRFFYVRTFTI